MYDVIIIGSGPAGYTAAIYGGRSLLKTLLLTGSQIGGQLTTTTDVENFPGFPEGIMGPELLTLMKKQAERFGAKMNIETVKTITKGIKEGFIVTTDTSSYEARSIIVATGASAKTLGIPSEEKFRGKGISYCATCDGFFFRGKHIAVLGGGDTAMEEATFLTNFASSVTVIHRRDTFRASPIMVEKAKKNTKISFLLHSQIEEFLGDTVLKAVRVKDTVTGSSKEMSFDGVFIAIGHTPATEFLKGVIAMDDKGYVQIQGIRAATDAHTKTSIDGIFAAGDCVDIRYRQGIVAAGMGAMAAIDVEKYLKE